MEELIFIIVLILLNGVFAMSEVALISAKKSRISAEAKRGNKSAQKVLELAEKPETFLSTVQIGITLIGILTGIFSGNKIAASLTEILISFDVNANYAHYIAQTFIVALVTFFSILFGELVPKRIGMGSAEKVALLTARPMSFLSKATYPFVWLLSQSSKLTFKVFGLKSEDSKVTEEEIKSLVQEGTEDGEVQQVEKNIVNRVFLMGDLEIGSIMTHKNDVVCLDCNMDTDTVRNVISDSLFGFYPVVKNSFDNLIGVVNIKELVLHIHETEMELEKLAHTPVFFPENMSVYKALESMKELGVSRALVCDEFGSFTGIITMKDILVGLVGNIDDTDEEPEIIEREDGSWLVSGQCSILDFLSYYDKCDLIDNLDCHTVGGLALVQLQHLPKTGETFSWKNFKFEIADMDGVRIDKLIVSKLP